MVSNDDAKDIPLVVIGKSTSVSCSVLLAIIQFNTRYIAELTYEVPTHGVMCVPSLIVFGRPQGSEMLIDVSSPYTILQTNCHTHTSLSRT